MNTNINKILLDRGYASFPKQEIAILEPELRQEYHRQIECGITKLVKFDIENLQLNQAISQFIKKDLDQYGLRYFVYYYKGKDLSYRHSDHKHGNLYICCLPHNKTGHFIPLMLYSEYTKRRNKDFIVI